MKPNDYFRVDYIMGTYAYYQNTEKCIKYRYPNCNTLEPRVEYIRYETADDIHPYCHGYTKRTKRMDKLPEGKKVGILYNKGD